MFIAAFVANVLTAVGIGLIWRTLIHTRRAADHAGGMLNEARKTTLAAEDAITQAEHAATMTIRAMDNTAERQLRAYVYFEDAQREKTGLATLDAEGKGWVVRANFKNYGQTPAYSTTIGVRISIEAADFDETALNVQNIMDGAPAGYTPPTPVYMPPGETANVEIPWPALQNHWADFKAGKVAMFLWGRIEYIDAFGKRRWATIRVKNTHRDGLGFLYCKTGNDAN
jgi:hypothetical protein